MKAIFQIVFLLLPMLGLSQNTVNPFMPEIVSLFPNVRDVAISSSGNEIMFTAQSVMGKASAIIAVRKNGDNWSTPEVASFSGQFFDLEPFFSQDGLKLYFVSNRPIEASTSEAENFDIWYVERKTLKDPWSKPINLGSPINTEYGEFYPSIADNGNFYFTRDDTSLNKKDDIYVSENDHGTYKEPKPLPDTINSEGYEYNAFVAPDESYLLFGCYNRNDGLGSGDLYISFNTESGWSKAKNLGNTINTDKMDYCPFVNNETLYFTSKQDNTKSSFETSLNIKEFLEVLNSYDNGSSRLYQISIKDIIRK